MEAEPLVIHDSLQIVQGIGVGVLAVLIVVSGLLAGWAILWVLWRIVKLIGPFCILVAITPILLPFMAVNWVRRTARENRA